MGLLKHSSIITQAQREHALVLTKQDPRDLPVPRSDQGRICMGIDLDETLVHSSFKPINNADFIVPVEMEGTTHQVYVLKRPYVDEFLRRMGKCLTVCSLHCQSGQVRRPVTDLLERCGVFRVRLFRKAYVFHQGCYIKALSRLERGLRKMLVLDNLPASYSFHPENAVPVQSWFDYMADTELLNLGRIFQELNAADDVYTSLGQLPARSLPGFPEAASPTLCLPL